VVHQSRRRVPHAQVRSDISPVLQLPDFNNELVVECDASGSGFRTVLHQGMGLVAFFSKLITAWHTKLDQRLSTANVASSTPSTRR
jgi:hypothetical protein